MMIAILILIFASAIIMADFLQAQMAANHPRLGADLRLLRDPPHAGVSDRPALRDTEFRQRHDVQHTIQLIPRLTGPALIAAVLVQDNDRVTMGQPLFQFDRHPYEDQVAQMEAQLAQARQNVNVLKADVDIAMHKVALTLAQLTYERYEKHAYDLLVRENSAAAEDVQKWQSRVDVAESSHLEAEAEFERANLNFHSQIDGVNTAVASSEAQLAQARYYLDNTMLLAPEDGRILNLQVRPGMVSGIYRIGGIAALIADADRYLLATYFQENLKYVRPGQPVEVAFDLYPGQIFKGRVDSIWKANGVGQFLPSDEIPKFHPQSPDVPQGQYGVKILLDDPDASKFPIGAQATAAIYTGGEHGAWAALRKISIRAHSWANWLYPMPF